MEKLFGFVNKVVGGDSPVKDRFLLPWEDYKQEAEELGIKGDLSSILKTEMLDISLDRANFLTFNCDSDPVDYAFDLESHVGSIMLLLEQDHNLKEQFRVLIPSYTSEDKFWKSYFYNIDHVKKAVLQKYTGKHVETRKIQDDHQQFLDELESELKVPVLPKNTQSDYQVLKNDLAEALKRIQQLEIRVAELEKKNSEEDKAESE